MDKLATLNIPENPERTPEQTAIIKEHFWAATNNRTPLEIAA
jgi:hypothetical protein